MDHVLAMVVLATVVGYLNQQIETSLNTLILTYEDKSWCCTHAEATPTCFNNAP
jgi:hypothetical protein